MKRYKLKESAKERYIAMFWLAVIIAGGLVNTWFGI